jgi:predicted GH43/DUF377 family glycosyl hydrolase
MKWRKLGLVFSPNNNYPWMVSHAACPIAEHLAGDLFRIYFSCRDTHDRSHTGYVEIDITQPLRVLGISLAPILEPGQVGYFDDSGTMACCLVQWGEKRYLYYIGWNRSVSVPFRNAIGLAVSDTGSKTFEKYSVGPILDRSVHDPCFVASCWVLPSFPLWRMWYLSATQWKSTSEGLRHFYHIKYAESLDGLEWSRSGLICIDFKSPEEYAVSRPCVLSDDRTYRMWYSYRGLSYRIGYAESENGLHWERKDDEVGIDVSESGWDSEMIEYPFIFDHKDGRYMLYNGNGYGKTGFGLAVLDK